MHYIDEGPHDGDVVLLLHGQPTCSYLYRNMIPVLAGAGLRVIAPDMIGMGRSDKPVQIADYRYLQHVAWVEELLDVLALIDITVFVQDWGVSSGCAWSATSRTDGMVLPFSDPALRDNPWPVNFAKWAAYALVGRLPVPHQHRRRAAHQRTCQRGSRCVRTASAHSVRPAGRRHGNRGGAELDPWPRRRRRRPTAPCL